MSKQEVILCESLETSLGRAIELCPHDKLFVLTDEHTQRLCLPSLKESGLLKDVRMTSYSSSQTNIPSVFVCPH